MKMVKYSKIPGDEIKYLKALVLNSQKLVTPSVYQTLIKVVKKTYNFEDVKVTEGEMSTLYLVLLSLLKKRLGSLAVDKSIMEEQLIHQVSHDEK